MHTKPRGIALFHGKLDPDTLNFLEESAAKLVHGPTGDFLDWTTIRAWAGQIVEALHTHPVVRE